jgi:hypothetical protein
MEICVGGIDVALAKLCTDYVLFYKETDKDSHTYDVHYVFILHL